MKTRSFILSAVLCYEGILWKYNGGFERIFEIPPSIVKSRTNVYIYRKLQRSIVPVEVPRPFTDHTFKTFFFLVNKRTINA